MDKNVPSQDQELLLNDASSKWHSYFDWKQFLRHYNVQKNWIAKHADEKFGEVTLAGLKDELQDSPDYIGPLDLLLRLMKIRICSKKHQHEFEAWWWWMCQPDKDWSTSAQELSENACMQEQHRVSILEHLLKRECLPFWKSLIDAHQDKAETRPLPSVLLQKLTADCSDHFFYDVADPDFKTPDVTCNDRVVGIV